MAGGQDGPHPRPRPGARFEHCTVSTRLSVSDCDVGDKPTAKAGRLRRPASDATEPGQTNEKPERLSVTVRWELLRMSVRLHNIAKGEACRATASKRDNGEQDNYTAPWQ